MDFVLSKVAISICALMVVAILGGMFGEGALLSPRAELDGVVDNLCSVVDVLGLSGAEGGISWFVPFASGGGAIFIQMDGVLVRAESGSERAVGQPVSQVRTWAYDGRPLNTSLLAELDGVGAVLEAHSGQSIDLKTKIVTLDSQPKMFVFAESRT